MLCINSVNIDSIECIRNPCLVSTVSTYIVFDGMVQKPLVLAFHNFNRIENGLNIKKVMSKNVYILCIDSVDIDNIECIRNHCLVSTVSTYVVFNGMVEKPTVSASQNFNQIENQLNIKKVMSKNVYVLCIDSVNIDSIECIRNHYVLYQQYQYTSIQY